MKSTTGRWSKHLYNARQRCRNGHTPFYRWYGAKGIQCTLTIQQVKYLWERDGASRMTQASLDRKDATKDYCLENCQFIEMKDNQQGGGVLVGSITGHYWSKYCNV